MNKGSHLDDAHAIALKAWRTKFPRGYMDHDDPFVVAIREEMSARALPSEPRTCETCGGKLTDCGPGQACEHWTPRSPQSADVETVRAALEKALRWLPGEVRHLRAKNDPRALQATNDLAYIREALDRIVGILRGSV